MTLPSSDGSAFDDSTASGSAGLMIWSNGAAAGTMTLPAPAQLVVRARGEQCQGAPAMTVLVDGRTEAQLTVGSTGWQDYPLATMVDAGQHRIEIAFRNDYSDAQCDRNLLVDRVTATEPPSQQPAAAMSLTAGSGQSYADADAPGGRGLLVWSDGTASTTLASTAPGRLVVRARGDQCAGAPTMAVAVDGQPVASLQVPSPVWQDFTISGTLAAGAHRIDVAFRGDYRDANCDRNLRLAQVSVIPVPAAPALIEAESMSLTPGAGMAFPDSSASAGAGLLVWSNGTAAATLQGPSGGRLVLRAKGDQCAGAPRADVTVDGTSVLRASVDKTSWQTLSAPWPGGTRKVEVSFTNDYSAGCDRNLRLDVVQVQPAGSVVAPSPVTAPAPTAPATPSAPAPTAPAPSAPAPTAPAPTAPVPSAPAPTAPVPSAPAPTAPAPTAPAPTAPAPTAPVPSAPAPTAPAPVLQGNPFAGARSYVDPNSNARREADTRRSWDPTGSLALEKIARGSAADWYGDWNPTSTLAATVANRMAVQTAAGALPVLVAYNIPIRDCGSYSAGGAASGAAYRAWITQLAAGIGTRKAAVVLEPDALPLMDCLTASQRAERTSMLSDAVDILMAKPQTAVYLDSGGPGWHTTSEMATRLSAAGVARARGFSLNVSGFGASGLVTAYGDELAGRLGGKNYVVDTSRNGLGSGDTWCNPAGRALGQGMTTITGSRYADAFTWVKAPGESDGTCGGGPSAGTWWADYAIGLASRAS